MNRVFLSGRVASIPRVAYTPKGRRMLTFPLKVDDGDLNIDVVYAGESEPRDTRETAGRNVLVAGRLVKAKDRTRDVMKVKASKIFWTEE